MTRKSAAGAFRDRYRGMQQHRLPSAAAALVRRSLAVLLLAVLVVVCAAASASAGTLSQQRARAAAIAAEIGALDARLATVVDRYAAAAQQLQTVEGQITQNEQLLRVAEWQVDVAQHVLSERAIAMYKEADVNIVGVILGSRSFGEILDKIALFEKLGQYDDEVLAEVQQTREEVLTRRTELMSQRTEASDLLAQCADERARIQAGLGERKATLTGLRGEIDGLEAALHRAVLKPLPAAPPATPAGVHGGGQTAPTKPNGWWPLIKQAADANSINAMGLYRLMMIESGGIASIVGGAGHQFCGLFQYWPPLWKASWNPWRAQSIFNGPAQIKATALAIRLGHGPFWWNPSYQWAFGTH
jgi:peptidoglycan hydrolase CwlO-like protein